MGRWTRAAGFALFACVALGVLYGGHFYLARRLVFDTELAGASRTLALAAIAILGASLIAQPFGERLLSHRVARWIAWPASLWMGSAFLLLLALFAADLASWVVGEPAFAAAGTTAAVESARLRATGALV